MAADIFQKELVTFLGACVDYGAVALTLKSLGSWSFGAVRYHREKDHSGPHVMQIFIGNVPGIFEMV
jgi:hypothetical protein